MTVKVGRAKSTQRRVSGGCPQGSILGVFLFNVTINDLEDDYLGKSNHVVGTPADHRRPAIRGPLPAPVSPVWQILPGGCPLASSSPVPSSSQPTLDLDELDVAVGLLAEFPANSGSTQHDNRRDLRRDAAPDGQARVELLDLPAEPNPPTQAKWRLFLIDLFKYIDDNLSCEKINMENVDRTQAGIRRKRGTQTQNLLRTVTAAADKKGMKVNHVKTKAGHLGLAHLQTVHLL